jgi:hypothetical protein
MKPAATGSDAAVADTKLDAGAVAAAQPISVVTRRAIAASADTLWQSLMFYEQIDIPPPLLLRVLLPRPIRTEGSKSAVGDKATCLYEGGHLLKAVTRIEPGRLYEFTVAEQHLVVGGRGVRLRGGHYALHALPGKRSELEVLTNYTSSKWPRWFWEPLEATVCHMFHRHLLGAIERKAVADAASGR